MEELAGLEGTCCRRKIFKSKCFQSVVSSFEKFEKLSKQFCIIARLDTYESCELRLKFEKFFDMRIEKLII